VTRATLKLWAACATQWRTGFAGVVGLDYNALFSVAGALNITINEQILDGIMLLEQEVLERQHKQGDKPGRPQGRNQ